MLHEFDKIWIENMHGNRKITEYAPDGKTSETVFAIKGFSPGIQQGITISTLVRKDNHIDDERLAETHYRNDLSDAKADIRRKHLLQTLEEKDFYANYERSEPSKRNRLTLRPSDVSDEYHSWPLLVDLCEMRSDGMFEKRGGALIDIDREDLEARIKKYFDKTVDWETLEGLKTGLTRDMARFDAKKAREKLQKAEDFDGRKLLRYGVRPFDNRYCYYSKTRPLWNEPRPRIWENYWESNNFLVTRLTTGSTAKGSPIYFSPHLVDGQIISVNPIAIPFLLRVQERTTKVQDQDSLFGVVEKVTRANLSEVARQYLISLGVSEIDDDAQTASLVWYHA